MSRMQIYQQISDERIRQDAKWGVQNHTPAVWLMILGEEVGEANKAALEALAPCGSPIGQREQWLREYREELIQVAAVAVSMVECLDRNELQEQVEGR